MKHANKILTQIPFSGFYCSHHDAEFDREFEWVVDAYAEETGRDIPQSLIDGMHQSVDWQSAYLDYAKEYVAQFLHEFMIDGEFESMQSPTFYNYSTDRVFAYITRDAVAMMWRKVNKRHFSEKCAQLFTSRDGFASSYSPDWRTWGKLSEWDHNQIYALVYTYAEHESLRGEFDEFDIIEPLAGNGVVSNAIHWNTWEGNGRDYWKIYEYLLDRARRNYRKEAA